MFFESVGEAVYIDFRDEWIGDGYGKADGKVLRIIRWVARNKGVILDPTYTGKAFTALIDLVDGGLITKGAKFLFWHTGGLLNLISVTEYHDDLLKEVV